MKMKLAVVQSAASAFSCVQSQINLEIISQGEIIDHLQAVHHSRSVMDCRRLQSGLCSAIRDFGLLWEG